MHTRNRGTKTVDYSALAGIKRTRIEMEQEGPVNKRQRTETRKRQAESELERSAKRMYNRYNSYGDDFIVGSQVTGNAHRSRSGTKRKHDSGKRFNKSKRRRRCRATRTREIKARRKKRRGKRSFSYFEFFNCCFFHITNPTSTLLRMEHKFYLEKSEKIFED